MSKQVKVSYGNGGRAGHDHSYEEDFELRS